MRIRKWCLLLLLLLTGVAVRAQYDPLKICRLENGKLIITLDSSWTMAQKLEVAGLFELDSVLVLNVYDGRKTITARGSTWSIRQLDRKRVELSKPMGSGETSTGTGNIIILDDKWINAEGVNKRESAVYGINRFDLDNAFSYRSGIACFFLPQHLQVRSVYLSGTFNNWGTLHTPMEKTDSGWVVHLKLAPGQYLYKFILDGKWIHDPNNKVRESDRNGGFNSVVFCYNYHFFLKGYPDAHVAVVSGSFNGWNKKELRMQRVSGGWFLDLYLREGTHAYKFIVDNLWILDPGNKVVRPDGSGNENSFISIGDTFYFRLAGHQACSHVAVAGNFNAWNPNETFLQPVIGGWEVPYVLAAGNYEYKYIVDNKWILDSVNSFVYYSGDNINSLKIIKPNHTFVLENFPDAQKVIVTGTFNGWSTQNYTMVKEKGRWVFPTSLKPGKYSYKFIVDGKWMEDPVNKQWEKNEYGTINSVLWIEP